MGCPDAASAAFEVGYESTSQFNREYSHFFGPTAHVDYSDSSLSRSSDVESVRTSAC
jgi:AraC-like DNA-binding protein